MLRSVFGKSLWDQRRGIAMWSLAIAAVGVLYAAFWPVMNNPQMAAALAAYPPELLDALGFTDITSPAGYLGATTFGLLGPILVLIFGAVLGSRAVAGEEEAGWLDVLLAHPVERWQVVVQRSAATVVAIALPMLLLYASLLVASGPADFTSIGPERLAAATLHLGILGLLFASLALAVGGLSGRRGLAWGVVVLVGVLGYIANTLGPQIDAIRWSRSFSPFYYYSGGRPLANGLQPDDALVLLGCSLVLVVVAVIGFRNRDVAV
ncbi:MAG TPA: ABC transporter permease subunit [Candidatus Limnocylindrales bacterium]|nr:ABC transporter permease subunit [Candidatus Limnocylindrales bacterium]